MKKKISLFIVALSIFGSCFAYKIEKDVNSVYSNVFKTLITIVKEQNPDQDPKLVLSASDFILQRIPEKIDGAAFEKRSKYKPAAKFEQAVWIRVEDMRLEEDKLYVTAIIQQQKNGEFVNWKDDIDNYELIYRCNFEDNTFELIDYLESATNNP